MRGGRKLLFNSQTRAMILLDADECDIWADWNSKSRDVPTQHNPVFAQSLINDGFLVQFSQDEMEVVKRNYFMNRHDSNVLMLTIAPTMACNLACGYCFQGLNKDVGKYDTRLPDAIMDFIKQQRTDLKKLSVTWYGGEPLMAKKEIFALADRMISYSDKNNIHYSSMIVTNGYFLTREVAQQLWSRRCTSAQVTVDGVEETHNKMRPLTSGRGSFKRIMENITDVLEETPLGISLRINVGHRNVDECDQLIDELHARGFPEKGNFLLYFAPIDAGTANSGTAFEEGLTRLEYNQAVLALGERARSLGMAAPIEAPKGFLGMCVASVDNGYVITHRGDVHKCWETAHDPRKRIGTIFEPNKLKHSLNNMLWEAWSPFESDVCRSCRILPMCGGFCGHRFLYQGNGGEDALPCPDWKWNTAEYIFLRAKQMGVVNEEDWIPGQETCTAMQSGVRHSTESLKAAQAAYLNYVAKKTEHDLSVDYLHNGDGRFFESINVESGELEENSQVPRLDVNPVGSKTEES